MSKYISSYLTLHLFHFLSNGFAQFLVLSNYHELGELIIHSLLLARKMRARRVSAFAYVWITIPICKKKKKITYEQVSMYNIVMQQNYIGKQFTIFAKLEYK